MFEEWEADFGRTFVLGQDPYKIKLKNDLEPVWLSVKKQWELNKGMSGEELYGIACQQARERGWEFGGRIAGHIVGNFPHERIPDDKVRLFITAGNKESMGVKDKEGRMRHWILEIHLVDREKQIGGFMEQLLTIG